MASASRSGDLLAPVAAGLIVHQRREKGLSVADIKTSIDDLLELTDPR